MSRAALALTVVLAAAVPAASQDEQAAMKAMKSPGPGHAALEPLVGEWDIEMRVWIPGAQQPDVARGTGTRAWTFGGRFVEETRSMRSDTLGPSQTRITVGHSNWARRYEWVLIGDHDTASYAYAGDYDAERRRFTGQGSWAFLDAKGAMVEVPMRVVSEWVGEGHDRMTTLVYFTFPGGKEAKAVEYVYVRRT